MGKRAVQEIFVHKSELAKNQTLPSLLVRQVIFKQEHMGRLSENQSAYTVPGGVGQRDMPNLAKQNLGEN